jgi:hypothetical protein
VNCRYICTRLHGVTMQETVMFNSLHLLFLLYCCILGEEERADYFSSKYSIGSVLLVKEQKFKHYHVM